MMLYKLIDNFYRAFISFGIAVILLIIYGIINTDSEITLYNSIIPEMIFSFVGVFISYLISKPYNSFIDILTKVCIYFAVLNGISIDAYSYSSFVKLSICLILAVCELVFKYSTTVNNLPKKLKGISMHTSYNIHFVYFLFCWLGSSVSLIAYFRNQDTTLMFYYGFFITILISGTFLLNLKKEKQQI